MDRNSVIRSLLLVFSGLIVSLWSIYLIASPTRYALAGVLFLITVVVVELLLRRKKTRPTVNNIKTLSNHLRSSQSLEDSIIILLAVASALVALIPPEEGSLFITWSEIPLTTVIRMVAAFSLNFLPGYAILIIVDKEAKFRGLARFVTAYLISVFLMTITAFACARMIGIINSSFLTAFLVINIILIAIYFLNRFRHRSISTGSLTYSLSSSLADRLPILLVVFSVAFQAIWTVGSLVKVDFFIGGPGSDQWRLHGFAQSYLDGRAFTWLHLIWGFHIYLAGFTVISGAPTVNAYLALYPLIVISKLSFYVMVSSFFRDRRVAALATLAYTIFSGPAGMYALDLRGYLPITDYDSWIKILWQTGGKFLFEGWYPPFPIGFVASDVAYACLWWLVYSAYRLDLRKPFNFILTSMALALSYLVHGIEPAIFTLFITAMLLVYLFAGDNGGKKKVRMAALSILLGLLVVALIDISLSDHYLFSLYSGVHYTFPHYYYFNTLHFYGIAAVSTIVLALSYISFGKPSWVLRFMSVMKKPAVLILFSVYALSIVVWIYALPDFDSGLIGTGSIPWYVYTGTGGIPFFLALVGVACLILKWRKWKKSVKYALVFCIFSISLLFLLGRIVSWVNVDLFYTGFWERRVLPYMAGLRSVLMAFALFALFRGWYAKKYNNAVRFGAVSFLVSILIISSSSTALVALDFSTRQEVYSPTREELEALTYLHYSLPKGWMTAYLNLRTGTYYIRSFSNDKWSYDPRLWVGAFAFSPEIILSFIGRGNVKLLYLHHTRDADELERNLFVEQLLRILPVEFNNSDVTIYSIPPLRPPQRSSLLGLMPYNQTSDASYDAYVLWLLTFAVSDYSYRMLDLFNPTVSGTSKVLILPYDSLPHESDVTRLWEWVANGGQLIVSNTNPYGAFSEFMGVTHRTTLVSGDSTANWGTLYGRGEILPENLEVVEGNSSLRMKNNQSSWEEWVYTVPDHWDLSEYQYLGIWVFGKGGGPRWFLHLFDSNGERSYPSFRYDLSVLDFTTRTLVPNFEGWKLHLIPIKDYFGNIDLSKIKELRIVTGFESSVEMLIDDIFVLKGYPSVTANGISGSEIIGLPNLTVQNISSSPDATLLANYTMNGIPVAPFAIQKSFGAGKVTYVNTNSLYKFILYESNERLFPEVLIKILETLNIEISPYTSD